MTYTEKEIKKYKEAILKLKPELLDLENKIRQKRMDLQYYITLLKDVESEGNIVMY